MGKLTSPSHDVYSLIDFIRICTISIIISTRWGGHLFRRFCFLFSESSPGCWAVLRLPCCPIKQARGTFRKHVTKPSEQVAAPPCIMMGFVVVYVFIYNLGNVKLPRSPCPPARRHSPSSTRPRPRGHLSTSCGGTHDWVGSPPRKTQSNCTG